MNNTVVAQKVALVEAGSQQQQYHRSYEPSLTNEAVYKLASSTRGGSILEPAAVSGVAGTIIKTSSDVIGQADIVNGWETRRYVFMAEIEVTMWDSLKLTQCIAGYTDYTGVAASGKVDPNMRMYINSAMTARHHMIDTPNGRKLEYYMEDNSNILNRSSVRNSNTGMDDRGVMQRPTDLFCRTNAMALNNVEDTVTVDYRSSMVNGPMKSSRANSSIPDYLSKSLTAYRNALLSTETGNCSAYKLSESAASHCQEAEVFDDSVLGMLMLNTDYRDRGYVTYSELCRLVKGFDERAMVLNSGSISHGGMSGYHGNAESMHAPSTETVTAVTLSNAISGVMSDSFITGLSFVATNMTLTGNIEINMGQGTQSFIKMPAASMRQYEQLFMVRLQPVLNDMSYGNKMPFSVSVRLNLYGETYMELSLNNGPSVPYIMPTFSDSLISPVHCIDDDSLQAMSTGVETLASNLNHNILQSRFG